MRMQLPVCLIAFHERRAMPSHGIRKRRLEKVVVTRQQFFGNAREENAPFLVQISDAAHWFDWQQ